MADIEMVIKIPEVIMEYIKRNRCLLVYTDEVANAVLDGTPLLKDHGRLIDSKALGDYFWEHRSRLFTHKDLQSIIDHAPTIIEADKGEQYG